MFLTENGNDFVTSSNEFDLPLGEAGILTMELELSESYHNTVESMIVAEHTAIVNEDTNLLNEAATSFFSKIGELFKKMADYLVSVWNKVVAFFRDKCDKVRDAIIKRKLKGVVEGTSVTLKTNRTLNLNIGAEALKMAKTATAAANKKIDEVKSLINDSNSSDTTASGMKKMEVYYGMAFPGLSEEDATDGEKFRNYVTEKLGITKKDESRSEKTFTVSNNMLSFVSEYNTTLRGTKEAFQEAIKAYRTIAKKLDTFARSLSKESFQRGYASQNASVARKIASKLNVALGITIKELRVQHSLCWGVISNAKRETKKEEKLAKKMNESTILDRFALV